MSRKAGTIVISLEAGTSKFMLDMDRAKAKVRDFGTSTKASGAEAAAAVKALEGNFTNSTRALSRFLNVTLGAGPIFAAAFPVIGAGLLGKAISDTGEKLVEFFKKVEESTRSEERR